MARKAKAKAPTPTLESQTEGMVEPGQEWRLGRVRIQVRPITAGGRNAVGLGSYTVVIRAARLEEVRRLIETNVVDVLTERGSDGRQRRR